MDPQAAPNLVDLGFLDARSKLIDLAAFLDRLKRHGQEEDYRVRALYQAFAELGRPGDAPDRARRVLLAFSDPSTEPIPAAHTKSAAGAWDAAPNP